MGFNTVNPLPPLFKLFSAAGRGPHERFQHTSNTSCLRSCSSDGGDPGREIRFLLSHGMPEEGSSFTKLKRCQTHKETIYNLRESEIGLIRTLLLLAGHLCSHPWQGKYETKVFLISPLEGPWSPVIRDAGHQIPPSRWHFSKPIFSLYF